MHSPLSRLLLLCVIVVAVHLGMVLLKRGFEPSSVIEPRVDISQLPLKFGNWEGEPIELDERIFARTGAKSYADRVYRAEGQLPVTLHSAMFYKYDQAVIHLPDLCFRAQEWQLESQRSIPLRLDDQTSITAVLSIWRKANERLMVAYWYQLDKQVILSRLDLAKARFFMTRKQWPPMVKFLLQTPIDSEEKAEARLKTIAEHVGRWALENLNPVEQTDASNIVEHTDTAAIVDQTESSQQ